MFHELFPSSIRFFLVYSYISYSRLCDEERSVVYNCEFDRYTLRKSLFQNDKPPSFFPFFLSFFRPSHSSQTPFSLCRVLRSPFFSCSFYMMENPTVSVRPRHPHTLLLHMRCVANNLWLFTPYFTVGSVL